MMTLERALDLNVLSMDRFDVLDLGIFRRHVPTQYPSVDTYPLYYHNGDIIPHTTDSALGDADAKIIPAENRTKKIQFHVCRDGADGFSVEYHWREMDLNGVWLGPWTGGDAAGPRCENRIKTQWCAVDKIPVPDDDEYSVRGMNMHRSDDVNFVFENGHFYQMPKNQAHMKMMLNQIQDYIKHSACMRAIDFQYLNGYILRLQHYQMMGMAQKEAAECLGLDAFNKLQMQLARKFYGRAR